MTLHHGWMAGWEGVSVGDGRRYSFLNLHAIHDVSILSVLLLDSVSSFIYNMKHFSENEEWALAYFKQKI